MVDKKLFTFKYERSDTVLSTPKTPVKRVPYKDIFSPKPERKKTESSSDFLIKIATGDFFEVFLRKESGADSKVCLLDTDCTAVRKTLGVIRNESERKDILREVEILKKVESPYVIKYIRDWEIDQHVFIEVEYCNLGTLRDYMNWVYFTQKSTFSKSLVKKIMTELVLGLQEIHRLKIVHLDLKPENIFLRSSVPSPSLCRSACTCEMPGEEEAFILKIGDFNISRYENEEMGMDGDKRYMAPEVLNGVCTRASDIYSLGLIYMEILNGIILPTSGEGWLRLRKNIFTGIKLEGPARKMLAKDYRKRIEASKLLTYFK